MLHLCTWRNVLTAKHGSCWAVSSANSLKCLLFIESSGSSWPPQSQPQPGTKDSAEIQLEHGLLSRASFFKHLMPWTAQIIRSVSQCSGCALRLAAVLEAAAGEIQIPSLSAQPVWLPRSWGYLRGQWQSRGPEKMVWIQGALHPLLAPALSCKFLLLALHSELLALHSFWIWLGGHRYLCRAEHNRHRKVCMHLPLGVLWPQSSFTFEEHAGHMMDMASCGRCSRGSKGGERVPFEPHIALLCGSQVRLRCSWDLSVACYPSKTTRVCPVASHMLKLWGFSKHWIVLAWASWFSKIKLMLIPHTCSCFPAYSLFWGCCDSILPFHPALLHIRPL